MLISVFTPLSATGNLYIQDAYDTLRTQTHEEWEWIVLQNHGGVLPAEIASDLRVKVFSDDQLEGIGALKRRCCELAKGEILFEFDHDDLLHCQALERAHVALQDADFCVSDFAEFKSGSWAPNCYDPFYGWSSYPVTFQGHELLAQPQPEITPHNLRRVEWAPNHLRAWRTDAYWSVGGHDPKLPVIDDHDLIVRGYLKGLRYVHIRECLYFYRVHPMQTVSQKNALIQELTQRVYDENITLLAEKFARDNALSQIDLCGGINNREGYTPLDKTLGHDLDGRWPLEDNSVGVLRAMDAIEHLKDAIHTMNEAYRVLAPGGFFLIQVPSTDGRGAFQDPTHVSFWNQNSFWYYTNRDYAKYLPDYAGRFHAIRSRTFFPVGMDAEGKPVRFHEQHNIPYVEVHLVALKDGYHPYGEVLI